MQNGPGFPRYQDLTPLLLNKLQKQAGHIHRVAKKHE